MVKAAVCKTVLGIIPSVGSIPTRTSIFECSSMTKHRTVNAGVAGSSPAIQAIWRSRGDRLAFA